MPKVSVILTVYNCEKYIKEAIDSILDQTFEDFELITINDGSTDGTLDIIKNYCDPRLIIIDNRDNVGIPKSLNKALQIAKGEYVARQDADDISIPIRLEKQVKFLDENKDLGFVGTSYYTIDSDGRETGIQECLSGKEAFHFMCMPAILVRRNCLDEVGGFREIFEIAEDYDLYLRISEKYRIGTIKEPLYKYRIHGSSITSKKLRTDLYASLAIEMADERKKTGQDRLSIVDPKEAIKIRNQRLNVSGIKKRIILSHTYSTWSQAAFALGSYRRSYNYAINSLHQNIFNYRAWNVLMKIVIKKLKDNPTKITHIKICRRLIKTVPWFRKEYWEHRAFDIDQKWGTANHDYTLLSEVILSLEPKRVLDVGCGSGRLFPLYNDLKVSEVVGQDISNKALKIARNRYQFSNIKTTKKNILDLKFPKHYFDLVISNRVLQHVPYNKIEKIISKLTELGSKIYINEMFNSDYSSESFYLFKHDYTELFDKYDFKMVQKGLLGRQTWFIFGRKDL